MTRTLFPLLATVSLLAACSAEQPDPADDVQTVDLPGQPGDPMPNPPPRPDGSVDGVNDGFPDLSQPVLAPEVERTETGARSLLVTFARAIELNEFDQAWALLSDADKERWSRADFAALFADLNEITVAVPDGTMEGAAGSSYYTGPVTVTGTDADGRPVRYEGEAVLRRVNDVPGASPEDLRWHFQSLTLDWTH